MSLVLVDLEIILNQYDLAQLDRQSYGGGECRAGLSPLEMKSVFFHYFLPK